MRAFDASYLDMGTRFRESLRYKPEFSTEILNLARTIVSDALARDGSTEITGKNFSRIRDLMHRDSRWRGLYSAGPVFERELKRHLGLPTE